MTRLAWLLLAWLALAAPVQAVQVADDRGVVLNFAQPPQRIVTLLPSLTETVCELGACDRLVGVDNYSNWPASVQRLTHVGGLDDASIELIVSLKPDLVLLASSSRALARLEGLGLRVMGLEMKTLADVQRVLGKVEQVLGVGGADRVWQRINAGIDAAARTVPASVRGTTVYFEVSSGPYAASESSHIGEVLARVGAANIVPGRLGTVPKLNPEFVVRADPQVIMISDRNPQAVKERPGWSRIRAIRDGRVCTFTAAQGDIIVRPGPRLAESAQLLADCLQGKLKGRAP
jgi:iron complex transport system substrate-binding protein